MEAVRRFLLTKTRTFANQSAVPSEDDRLNLIIIVRYINKVYVKMI